MEEERERKEEKNRAKIARRFISSSKGLDRFMNLIDFSVKKGHKISSRYVGENINS